MEQETRAFASLFRLHTEQRRGNVRRHDRGPEIARSPQYCTGGCGLLC